MEMGDGDGRPREPGRGEEMKSTDVEMNTHALVTSAADMPITSMVQ